MIGINSTRTKWNWLGKTSLHAEMDILQKMSKKKIITGDMIVIRINNQGNLCNSRPCKYCIYRLQKLSNIRFIYYSNKDGEIVREKLSQMIS